MKKIITIEIYIENPSERGFEDTLKATDEIFESLEHLNPMVETSIRHISEN